MLVTEENINSCDLTSGFFILVNKPLRVSSFYVVDKLKFALRHKTQQKIKIGHAGTLDPLATGLLILCTGSKTKSISQFQEMEKTYSGTFTLGATTASYDLETEVTDSISTEGISLEDIERVRKSFLGYQEIVPPIHSAIKLNGKRAYELARKGHVPELAAKPIYISKFEIEASNFPVIQFVISCTKGTYIRSIAYEFGKRLNNAAYLSSLHRDSIGEYSSKNAFELEDLIVKLKV
ncbi:MAG: tRNA pseudouridine(55) synthase TruB [Saprospiraceae bacterium]